MKFTFPEIKTTRNKFQSLTKIEEEIYEYRRTREDENEDEEAIDILHSAETFIRKQFHGREEVLDKLIEQVILKNKERGYYSHKCF